MKRVLTGLLLLAASIFFCVQSAEAKTYKVEIKFLEPFSTSTPKKTVKVITTADTIISATQRLEKDSEFELEVTNISTEKRGKIDANFEARVKTVSIPSENKTIEIKNPNAIVKISKYKKLDVPDKACDVGVTVANHFVNNIAYPVNFVRGAIKDETGNRLSSGAKTVYEKSVLSYASKGKPLTLNTGDLAIMSFYLEDKGEEN